VTVGGQTLELERGKKYRVLGSKWNSNPRPYTPEESRRHADLIGKLTNPSASPEERVSADKELRAFAEAHGSGLALGMEWWSHYWVPLPGQAEPPDSEAIVIDLRNR
jgi:hypothetical protein